MISGAEKPAGVAIYHFVTAKHEDREELVAVRVVSGLAGVVAAYAVFVVVVETVALTRRAVLGKAVGVAFLVFSENNELSLASWLARLAQVSPEAGFFHEVSPAVEEVPGGFRGDLGVALFDGGATHVWGAAAGRGDDTTALAEQGAKGGE